MLGGFSMGTVMSYALGLGGDRPAPGGILAFSGFVPTVEGWQPHLSDRESTVFIAHGRNDPVIEVGFARRALELIAAAGSRSTTTSRTQGTRSSRSDSRDAVRWLADLLPPAD